MAAFSWDSPTWGQAGFNVHIGLETGDTHTASEDAAEARRA
jgi:hypothetical protein